ncbi:MAG: hypothetical protein NXI01_06505 [Gammaproteobacteria bacterium]|nr:hypothetical protein [Gammaproteobacteria bacterium]
MPIDKINPIKIDFPKLDDGKQSYTRKLRRALIPDIVHFSNTIKRKAEDLGVEEQAHIQPLMSELAQLDGFIDAYTQAQSTEESTVILGKIEATTKDMAQRHSDSIMPEDTFHQEPYEKLLDALKNQAQIWTVQQTLITDIQQLDTLISNYSKASSPDEKMVLIAKIEATMQAMAHKYPDETMSAYPEHEKTYKKLRDAIENQAYVSPFRPALMPDIKQLGKTIKYNAEKFGAEGQSHLPNLMSELAQLDGFIDAYTQAQSPEERTQAFSKIESITIAMAHRYSNNIVPENTTHQETYKELLDAIKTQEQIWAFHQTLIADFEQIYAQIDDYNKALSQNEKMELIAEIETTMRTLDQKYPDGAVRAYPEHEKAYKKLHDSIKSRAYLLKFHQALTPDIAHLNNLIAIYHQAQTPNEKKQAIYMLETAMLDIDRKYPDDLMRICPDYHSTFHKNLFSAIQQEKKALGLLPDESTLNFQEFVALMPPEKIDRMLLILITPGFTREKLYDVYDADEKGRNVFLALIDNYDIEIMKGNNSKNFTLTDKTTDAITVLKVEKRMSVPKEGAHHLRTHSMAETFTPIQSERQAMCIDPNTKSATVRTILFTTFEQGGDLEYHAKTHPNLEKKLDDALFIYIQMALILEKIQADGHVFLDMKNSNWLIDSFGELLIADTKSFLWSDDEEEREVQRTHIKNTFYSVLCSYQMNPPEYYDYANKDASISVEKLHAFMLGKNLYQYMETCEANGFLRLDQMRDMQKLENIKSKDSYIHRARDLPFTNTIFETERGKEIKRLIGMLVLEDPEDRITLQTLIENLAFIAYPELATVYDPDLLALKIQNHQLLKSIAAFKINGDDTIITAFVDAQREAINAADNVEALNAIHKDLAAIKYYLRNNRAQLRAVKEMINAYKTSADPDEVAKGLRIEAAMIRVPLMERGHLADGKTKAQKTVLTTMASDLGLFNRMVQSFRQKNGQHENTGNDTEKFVKFKKQFETHKPKPYDPPNIPTLN